MKKPFLLVANLKMNLLSRDEVKQYLQVLHREAEGRKITQAEVIMCPPMLWVNEFSHVLGGFHNGAQNVFWVISPVMLKNDGIEYVLIGHSERRLYAGETDEIVRTKTHSALKHLLTPIVCIGESEEERRRGMVASVLEMQLVSIVT